MSTTTRYILSVEQVLSHIGIGKYQYYLLAMIGSVWLSIGCQIMLLAFLIPVLKKEWGDEYVSLIGMVHFAGSICGSQSLGILSDIYGRKRIISISFVCSAVVGFLSALSPSLVWMMISRFFIGYFVTAGAVAFTWFSEFIPPVDLNRNKHKRDTITATMQSPKNIITRGRLLILTGLFWSSGTLLSVLIAWMSLTFFNWRYYLVFSTIPLCIAIIIIYFVPESPQFLAVSNQIEKAKDVLSEIAQWNEVQLTDNWTLKPDEITQRGSICDLFVAKRRRTTILLFILHVCCIFSYYGFSFICVRYFAMLDIFYALHTELYWKMTLTTAAEIPALVIGVLLIDKGRLKLLALIFFSFAVCSYALAVYEIEEHRLIGISFVFIGRMFIDVGFVGMGIYFVEYYPTYIRDTAMGTAMALGRLAAILAVIAAEEIQIPIGFYLFGSIGLLAFIATISIEKDIVG